jgi:hypothetical protein
VSRENQKIDERFDFDRLLDALFDRFLISFDEHGVLLIAPGLAGCDVQSLGISPSMKLRWVNALHQPYLALHCDRLVQTRPVG